MIRPAAPRIRTLLALSLCLLATACQRSADDQLADAKLQQEIGAWPESVAILQEILAEDPGHPEANLLLGLAQLRSNEPELAIWPLEIAARSPEFADAADVVLGGAYIHLDQVDAAIAAADRVLARNPEDPATRGDALKLRATAHLNARNWDAGLEDVDRLLALVPGDPEALVLKAQAYLGAGRIDEAEAAMREIWDDPDAGATPAVAQAGISLAKLYAYHREDMVTAEEHLERLLERFPNDRTVLGFTVDFLVRRDRSERASEILEAALEKDPGDLFLRGRLAELLVAGGETEKAEKLLTEATELFDSPEAWLELSDFHRTRGQPDEALVAMERGLSLIPGTSDILRFRYAGILADTGALNRAAAETREIEGVAYREMMLGRLAFMRGEPEEALRHFDAALHEWPNNAGGRYLAGKAAMALGDMDRGIEELREAMRSGMESTDAPIELAHIYLELGRADAAIQTVGMLMQQAEQKDGPRLTAAALLLAKAQWESGDRARARSTLDQVLNNPEIQVPRHLVVVEQARFAEIESGSAAGLKVLVDSGVDWSDPAHTVGLRMMCEWLLELGQGERALEAVAKASDAHPEVAEFHDIRGRLLINLDRVDEASSAFDRALEIDADYAPAVEAKGGLALLAGQRDEARKLFDQASELDRSNSAYPYQAAQIELSAGRIAGATERLRRTLERNPVHADASNDLAWILAESGEDLDRALSLATRASRMNPVPAVLDTLGWVRYKRGEYEQAVAAFEHALKLDENSPSIAYRLGVAHAANGEKQKATESFERALAAGPFPESEAARAELAKLGATES